ncbi:MAG: acyl-CoA thioesterase [Spirulinaceae cyanobacterium SM2_1_0]|nr:acyl-CoA thioesterase [Spirulinaceae cyanobacterium SM2_1_0]
MLKFLGGLLMPFEYPYTLRLADTDAAGVVYFAEVLRICHEAYEEALLALGCDWRQMLQQSELVLPVVHSSADLLAPMFCGDRLLIILTPKRLRASEFSVRYHLFAQDNRDRLLARARTRHVCIQRASRQRCDLPGAIAQWVDGSA